LRHSDVSATAYGVNKIPFHRDLPRLEPPPVAVVLS